MKKRFINFHTIYLLTTFALFFLYFLSGSQKHLNPSGKSLEAPSFQHILGTDDIGIDIFSQLCYGGGVSIAIGFVSGLIAVTLGIVIGASAGLIGGRTDKILMSFADMFMAIPQMVLLILLGSFLGSNYMTLTLVLGLLSWAMTARVVRSKVIFLKHETYVTYSLKHGVGFLQIIRQHFIPHIKEICILQFIKIMSKSIVMEASLAYLGLANPISKSWGMMINRSMSFPGIYFTPFWKWWILPPLVGLIGLVLSLMLLGNEFESGGVVYEKK